MKNTKKISVISLILIIFTMVFGFNNIPRSFFLMGYSAIPWFVLSSILFFIPFAIINAEFGSSFKDARGGLYTWMEKSVGPRFAFIGIFMWYSSQVIFMISTALNVWLGISYVIWGKDITSDIHPFGISTPFLFLILGVTWVVVLTIMGTSGVRWINIVSSLGGIATVMLNLVLLIGGVIVFINNGAVFKESVTLNSFISSPNKDYQNIIAMSGFVVMALFAYAGIETVAGYTDKIENAEKNFPKALSISSSVITLGYALGIFVIGMFVNWNTDLGSSGKVHIGNAVYEIMRRLGNSLGQTFGMQDPNVLGIIIVRFMALCLVLALTGGFASYFYAPLKQLIEGTPDSYWPKSFATVNDRVSKHAMYSQSAIMIVIIVIVALTGGIGGKFFNNITMMMNTAMTLPFVFISIAYIYFKKNESIKKPFIVFKSTKFAVYAAISCCITVILGNILQIADPITNFYRMQNTFNEVERLNAQYDAYLNAAFMLFSPILFSILAVFIYRRGKKALREKELSKNLGN